jgi:hypothetical protein
MQFNSHNLLSVHRRQQSNYTMTAAEERKGHHIPAAPTRYSFIMNAALFTKEASQITAVIITLLESV